MTDRTWCVYVEYVFATYNITALKRVWNNIQKKLYPLDQVSSMLTCHISVS